MVYGKITELRKYIDAEIYVYIERFLRGVREDMAEGEYPIMGDRIFARVVSYRTSPSEQCKIEAHNRYIDIQATITGAEGISIYDRDGLRECVSYREDRDVVLFKETEHPIAHTINSPGRFTMLYPQEAHRPEERIHGIDKVKKFVIKLAVEDMD